ncbi:hypothetical protein PsYK624_086930 [Phanerochaete sordida]|uniref:Uncharacterized protein n=1 Tax=Phanerochaete sordida TaxID=48140 RepID=A0A9P3GAN2_9APHY|nr:hypothetical protein PsYK624_086930 [Phanerochaete sordida]
MAAVLAATLVTRLALAMSPPEKSLTEHLEDIDSSIRFADALANALRGLMHAHPGFCTPEELNSVTKVLEQYVYMN